MRFDKVMEILDRDADCNKFTVSFRDPPRLWMPVLALLVRTRIIDVNGLSELRLWEVTEMNSLDSSSDNPRRIHRRFIHIGPMFNERLFALSISEHVTFIRGWHERRSEIACEFANSAR